MALTLNTSAPALQRLVGPCSAGASPKGQLMLYGLNTEHIVSQWKQNEKLSLRCCWTQYRQHDQHHVKLSTCFNTETQGHNFTEEEITHQHFIESDETSDLDMLVTTVEST